MNRHSKIIALLLVAIVLIALFLFTEYKAELDGPLVPGTILNDLYISGYNGLTFTLPEGWKFVKAKELESYLNNQLQGKCVVDMAAIDNDTVTSIIVAYFKQSPFTALTNEKKLVEKLQNKIADGASVNDIYEEEIGSGTYYAFFVDSNDGNINKQYVYNRRIGRYMLVIFISGNNDDAISDAMENFS